MKIQKVEYETVRFALKTPFKTALRTAYDVECVRVFILCDGGFQGISEAPATKAITGEGLEEIIASLDFVRESFYGLSPDEALKVLHQSTIGSSTKAVLDMACVSLLLQEKGQALQDYLHIKDMQAIYTAITISFNDVETMLLHAKEAYASGMGLLKLKLGKNITHAIEVTHAIAMALPHAKILIDPNQAWSVEDSAVYLQNISTLKISLLEQPVAAGDIDGLKRIKEFSHIPIVADEAVFSLEDAKRVMGQKCADMFNIKLMKCAGMTKAIELLEYARRENIKVMLGSMLEGPNSINYALYLAFAYRDVIAFVDLDSPLLLSEMPKEIDFIYDGWKISPSF